MKIGSGCEKFLYDHAITSDQYSIGDWLKRWMNEYPLKLIIAMANSQVTFNRLAPYFNNFEGEEYKTWTVYVGGSNFLDDRNATHMIRGILQGLVEGKDYFTVAFEHESDIRGNLEEKSITLCLLKHHVTVNYHESLGPERINFIGNVTKRCVLTTYIHVITKIFEQGMNCNLNLIYFKLIFFVYSSYAYS